jgi:hypothetical protein
LVTGGSQHRASIDSCLATGKIISGYNSLRVYLRTGVLGISKLICFIRKNSGELHPATKPDGKVSSYLDRIQATSGDKCHTTDRNSAAKTPAVLAIFMTFG